MARSSRRTQARPNSVLLECKSSTGNKRKGCVPDIHASSRLRTIVVLIKLCFATGVLSIPAALGTVGYGPGLVLLALWSSLTMCMFSCGQTPPSWWLTRDNRLFLHHVLISNEVQGRPYHCRWRNAYGGTHCARDRQRSLSVDMDVSFRSNNLSSIAQLADNPVYQ